jgi:type VI secretion system protein ImpF
LIKAAIDRPVQQSVLDRLTNLPQGAAGAALPAYDTLPDVLPSSVRQQTMWELSVQALKDAVRRDLEWLLNTRRTPAVAPEELAEVTRSVYHYGLPDMTAFARTSPRDRERLARQVEEAIAIFEPRLSGVRVTLAENGKNGDGANGGEEGPEVRFVIEGLLRVDPTPERVVFDTVLETPSGEYQVRGSRDA